MNLPHRQRRRPDGGTRQPLPTRRRPGTANRGRIGISAYSRVLHRHLDLHDRREGRRRYTAIVLIALVFFVLTVGFGIGEFAYRMDNGVYWLLGVTLAVTIIVNINEIRGLPIDLYAYKAQNWEYPNQPTTHQFFGERQFEAYRELGYQLTRELINDPKVMEMLP